MLTLLKAGSICGMENCSYSKIRDTKNKNGANLLAGWIQFKLIFSGLDSMTSVYILLIPQLAFWWSTHYWSHLKNKQTKNPECDCINSQDWFFLLGGGGLDTSKSDHITLQRFFALHSRKSQLSYGTRASFAGVPYFSIIFFWANTWSLAPYSELIELCSS